MVQGNKQNVEPELINQMLLMFIIIFLAGQGSLWYSLEIRYAFLKKIFFKFGHLSFTYWLTEYT